MRTRTTRKKGHSAQPWEKRLYLPAYRVATAAQYAHVSTQTIRNWQVAGTSGAAIDERDAGKSLSYFQLQELALVSAMRQLGVPLHKIRLARDYLKTAFKLEYPFANERVKTDGQDVLMQTDAFKHLVANRGGQFAWADIIGKKFAEFEYERDIALRWTIRKDSHNPIIIDPRIAFGAPAIAGVPTWAILGRERAGEDEDEIAYDFGLTIPQVRAALRFENELPRRRGQ